MCLTVSPGNNDEEPALLAEGEQNTAIEATVGPSERKVRPIGSFRDAGQS